MASADTNKCTYFFLQIAENLYVYSYFDDPWVKPDRVLFEVYVFTSQKKNYFVNGLLLVHIMKYHPIGLSYQQKSWY